MSTGKRKQREAIAYRRVSTERQGESGVGLERQMAAISTYASLDKRHIVESFDDVGSGMGDKNLVNRPGLQAAIRLAKATGAPIIVDELSRISRDTKTIDEIVRKHGLTIISAGDGVMRNPVIVASQAARAQRDGELISEKTKEALQLKKAQGVVLGNRTNLPEAQRLGVQKKKELAAASVTQIVRVLKEVPDQQLSASDVVEILNERGILTSRKIPWTLAGVKRPLRAARKVLNSQSADAIAERSKQNPLFGRY